MPTTVPAEKASGVVLRTSRETRTFAPPVRRCWVKIERAEMTGSRPEQVTTMARMGVRTYVAGRRAETER